MDRVLQTWPVFWFSLWHMLLPGHIKTLLLAVRISGTPRGELLLLAIGYSLSHGCLMAAALFGGAMMAEWISGLAPAGQMLVSHSYVPLLAVFGFYFVLRALEAGLRHRTPAASGSEGASRPRLPNQAIGMRTFAGGVVLGSVPCAGVVGFALVGPALLQIPVSLGPALVAAWLGVAVAAIGIAAVLCLLPVGAIRDRLPTWVPYAASGGLCIAVSLLRGYQLWHDWQLLH